MYAVAIGHIERAIYDLEQHFGVDYDGLTNRECVENLRGLCPKLHSEEDLIKFGEGLLDKLEENYGFKGLRIWYRIRMQYAFFGHELLHEKYYKLFKEIEDFVNEYREEQGLTLMLDVYLASVYLKETYKKRYGVFDPQRLMDLYGILRTIHMSDYNPILIKECEYLINHELWKQGDKYYSKRDLTDKEELNKLYIHVAEEIGDDTAYTGKKMFYEYDGYGGSYFQV